MVVFTACLLAAIATGVTGALSSGLCNMFHSCAPRRSNRDDGDAVDEPAVQGDVPVQDESQQPLALSATSSSKDYIRSSDNNDNKGAALVLLPLQHGQQVLRLSSRASLDRLYNWASIPYPLSQRAVHAAFERILLWSPGSNSAAQAPAATAMTTALIPLSSGPVPASRCFFSIIPDPAPTVSRTANVFTTHLHGMGPADGDHCVTEMMTTEALQGMLVVPSHQHYQQEQPPASYHTVSNALVRYDKAYATTKAAVAPFAKSPASFKDISTFMSHMGLAGLCFLKDGTSKAGGKCGFVPNGSAGTKTWSWSGELFGGQKATPTETGTAMKLQQFEETGGPVGDETVSMVDVKGEEDVALKLKLESVDVSTTPPLTPASIPPSPAVTTSEEPGKNSSSFFADTCYDDGGSTSSNISISTSTSTGASSSEDEAASVRVQQRAIDVAQLDPPLRAPTELVNPEADVQAVQGSGAPLKKAKLRHVDTRAAEERTAAVVAAATEQGAGNNAEKFDPTKEREPGQLRQAFLKNLRRSKVGSFGDICVAVRVAQAALGGNEVDDGDLQRGDALGQGSFGIVWACRHTVLQGDFAVKMLKPDAAKEARYCATAEMVALTRLTKSPHENVVGAVAIDDRIERMSILFPKANFDLLTMLQHDCLSMLDRIRCLQQVSSGVGHMHELGIGHGDIKPANVLMYDNGQGGLWPKVCDFGMARGMGEERPAMMGTMGFMPPEVMRGETITHGSQDVWAMGVMAFLLCMSPDKALPNPFVSPELYTDREVRDKKALEDEGGDGCPSLAERRQHFEAKMTRRTMADRSCFKRLMAPDNLHPDLPTFQVKMTANLLILPFVDMEPTLRPNMACFEVVMGNFATEVEEAIAEQRAAEGQTDEESDDVGLDLDGDDGGYEDNEFF